MSNFGVLRLRVVNPYKLAFREARSAVGASPVLADAEEFDSVAAAVADCTLVVGTTAVGRRELQHPLRQLKDGARLVRTRLKSSRVALLFGSEKIGLTNEAFSHCDWLMRIPTREEHRSMNLGQAVAVCLYELTRNAEAHVAPAAPAFSQAATAAEVERVASVLLEALRASGSLQTRSAALTEQKVRRLIRRHRLTAADAEFWLGMLRQIIWRIKVGKDFRS
jgi:TrmH family RNA methyltransferase